VDWGGRGLLPMARDWSQVRITGAEGRSSPDFASQTALALGCSRFPPLPAVSESNALMSAFFFPKIDYFKRLF
jgi:hypothetical protein